jgi:hypothetical protein
MDVGKFLVGLLCFLGIIAYWYFLPYRFWLGLISPSSTLGAILGNFLILIITMFVGILVTVVLGFVGLIIWLED